MLTLEMVIKELIKKEEKKENRGWQPTPTDV